MTTFTLYRADVHNIFESKDEPVFDVFYYLDSDSNYNSKAQYKLPDGWQLVEVKDDFNYLLTDTGNVIEGRDINHDKAKNRPFARYLSDGGTARYDFEELDND